MMNEAWGITLNGPALDRKSGTPPAICPRPITQIQAFGRKFGVNRWRRKLPVCRVFTVPRRLSWLRVIFVGRDGDFGKLGSGHPALNRLFLLTLVSISVAHEMLARLLLVLSVEIPGLRYGNAQRCKTNRPPQPGVASWGRRHTAHWRNQARQCDSGGEAESQASGWGKLCPAAIEAEEMIETPMPLALIA